MPFVSENLKMQPTAVEPPLFPEKQDLTFIPMIPPNLGNVLTMKMPASFAYMVPTL